MSSSVPAPTGDVVKRTLHFFWIADYSASMSGERIATLNYAIQESIPAIRAAVKAQPSVQVQMRAIKFSEDASWHVGPAPVPLEQFVWPELSIFKNTATGKAIRMLASELTLEKMPRRGLPPVCILLSDGKHTDKSGEYEGAISDLEALPWGVHAVRLAIAIGQDETEYDEQELLKFVSHKEVGVLKAHSPQELVKYIEWASKSAVNASAQGKSKAGQAGGNSHVQMPPRPSVTAVTAATDGF